MRKTLMLSTTPSDGDRPAPILESGRPTYKRSFAIFTWILLGVLGAACVSSVGAINKADPTTLQKVLKDMPDTVAVAVIYKDGNWELFPKGTSISFKEVLSKKARLVNFGSVTFAISEASPGEFCWITTDGRRKCVTW